MAIANRSTASGGLANPTALLRSIALKSYVPAPGDSSLPNPRKSATMNTLKLIGMMLIVAGALGLVYGGFSYTKESAGVKLGPLELKVVQRETVNVPMLLSAGAVAVGIFLLVFKTK